MKIALGAAVLLGAGTGAGIISGTGAGGGDGVSAGAGAVAAAAGESMLPKSAPRLPKASIGLEAILAGSGGDGSGGSWRDDRSSPGATPSPAGADGGICGMEPISGCAGAGIVWGWAGGSGTDMPANASSTDMLA